jgi:signal peptidase I
MKFQSFLFIVVLSFSSGCYQIPRREYYLHKNDMTSAIVTANRWNVESPESHTWGRVPTVSASMRPALEGGEYVLARRPLPGEPLLGFIAWVDGKFLHRVVWEGFGKVVTRGDANATNDRPIHRDEIKWVVVYVVTFPQ